MSDVNRAQAEIIHKQGLEKVKNTPEPKGQKFPAGSRVRIADDLGRYMSHFKSGVNATVEYVYAHAYGGDDVKNYSLNIDNHGSSAWYEEHQLTSIDVGDAPMNCNEEFKKLYVEGVEYVSYEIWASAWGVLYPKIENLESRIKELEQASEWISVDDRLPEDDETVIVAGGIAYVMDGKWYSATGEANGRLIQWNVTHWQPLPRPPTNKAAS